MYPTDELRLPRPSQGETRVPIETPTTDRRSIFWERFVDSFFHENNIRWMLVIGAAIVFASSMMLVTHEWSTWSATFKYLTIVAYTSAIFGFSEVARRRLGLLATANVLQALTLLLLPIPFLSLSWLGADTWMGVAESGAHAIVLLLPTVLLTWFLSQRIFEHLVRGRQPTFQASYCLLCLAGAMPALHRTSSISESAAAWIAAAVSILLWTVMTIGVIKVNRHVFWLAEEHRLPRIFGFFPIALLGGQFLVLLAAKTAWVIEVEWLGFGCVMVAGTMLAASQSIARVFKERTGNLVRPLPWPIVLPIFVGLATLALGVAVSGWGFSYTGSTTYALVPTAAVAAGLLMLAARETGHRGFVWCGLLLVAIAYQCAPTLAGGLVAWLKSSAAAAVHEDQLPLAFYGLTYLPLLSVLAIASRLFANRHRLEFSQPLQQFVTILSIALLALSLTHLKAILPVSLISVATCLAMAILFRDRRYVLVSITALLLATAAFVPVANAMHWVSIPQKHTVLALAMLAGLSSLGSSLDRWLELIPLADSTNNFGMLDSHGQPRKILMIFSVLLSVGLSVVWLSISAVFIFTRDPQWNLNLAGVVLIAGLALQTLRSKLYASGLNFWLLAAVAVLIEVIQLGGSAMAIANTLSWFTATIALASWCVLRIYQLERNSAVLRSKSIPPNDSMAEPCGSRMQITGAFVGPLCDVSMIATLCLATVFHLPQLIVANIALSGLAAPIASTLVLAACCVFAVILRDRGMLAVSVIVLPLWFSAVASTVAASYRNFALLPLLWTIPLGMILLASERLVAPWQSTANAAVHRSQVIGLVCGRISAVALLVILCGSVFYLSLTTLTSVLLAASLLLYANRSRLSFHLVGLALVLNVFSIYLAEVLLGNRGWLFLVPMTQWLSSLPYLLPLLAMSVAVFDHPWRMLVNNGPLTNNGHLEIRSWAFCLRTAFALVALVCCFAIDVTSREAVWVVVAVVIMIAAEIRHAVRLQATRHLWLSLVMVLLLIAFLSAQHFIVFGSGITQLALLLVAILALSLSRLSVEHPHFGFATKMLAQVGLSIPGCIVLLGVHRAAMPAGTTAVNTLAMLAAAGIYFYHGTATKQRWFVVAAVVILNVSLLIAWQSLRWYDLQLYLVPLGISVVGLAELLRKELPTNAHDPLRYVGALTILVSPMLDILRGSWWHLLTLLLLCVGVILASIGLRLRALMMTGMAFLFINLVSMVIHSSYDHPQLLWIAGLGVGAAVIALAAVCENHRENLLARIRLISAELATWR